MAKTNEPDRVLRDAKLTWVPIPRMKVSPLAQRELNQARVDRMATDFDLEQIGTPTVNLRASTYYIIDGQHRIEALRSMGWDDQQVECWAYEGLSEQDEAEMFLKLNDVLAVGAFDKFRVGVQAGRPFECDIDRVVRSENLRVSRDQLPGSIRAVGTLRRLYARTDPDTLAQTLRIIRDAFGDAGLEAVVIDGVGLVCGRYVDLDEEMFVKRLGNLHGGVNGLLGLAEKVRARTGSPKAHCVAAATVTVVNRGRGGAKLSPWWREDP